MVSENSRLIETLLDLSELPHAELDRLALKIAGFSLFDWMACGLAGVDEPLSGKLRSFAATEAGRPVASIFGAGPAGSTKVPARMAALVNGATGHALDYDDTHFAHIGHLSVGIYPAALAVGEETGAWAEQVVAAFLVGAEAAIRAGMALGPAHYNRGFHQTATAGAFGATVAAGRLYGLTREQKRAALGLCATRASGLKAQFGTMGKPYNAGIAASNGVECAALARLGMTSIVDGLFGPQAFVATHSDAPSDDVAPVGKFLFPDISYKFHACCHGTHAMIEALLAAKQKVALTLDTVDRVRISTNPRWMSVCNIERPATGLEVKFSYRWLAGMVLGGVETGSEKVFTDAIAVDPGLAAFAPKVIVTSDDTLTDMQVAGQVELRDGNSIPLAYDLAGSISPAVLEGKLRAKADAMLGKDAAALYAVLDDLRALSADDLGRLARCEQ